MGSEQPDAEDRLRESEARFRAAFEDVGVAVCLLRPDGSFLDVNEATSRLFGYSKEELLHKSIDDLSHPEDMGISQAFRSGALGQEFNHGQFVKRYLHRDGRVLWVSVSSSIVRVPEGKSSYFVSHLQDITERVRMEAELDDLTTSLEQRIRERTAELESVNRELESFSYSVSHDLRTPLRAIDGFSKLLLESSGEHIDAEGRRLLDVIRGNAKRMGQLIDDLLAFSQLNRGEIRRVELKMNELVESVIVEVVPDLEKRRRITFRISALPSSWGDEALIRQVLMNLISNAVKFSSKVEHPEIEIHGVVREDHVLYRVGDNGAGFDMAYASKLFKVFQRLHRVNEFEGTGVGLALVHRIISRHGGGVWADGVYGKGATFTFSLPNRKATPPRPRSGEFAAFRN